MSHLIRRKRKFDGKTYIAKEAFNSQTYAKGVAYHMKKMGYSIRITKEKMPKGGYEYYLWARRT